MCVRRHAALILYRTIIVREFTKHSTFETLFDYGFDRVMKIFNNCEWVFLKDFDSIGPRKPFRSKISNIDLYASIQQCQRGMKVTWINRDIDDRTAKRDNGGL